MGADASDHSVQVRQLARLYRDQRGLSAIRAIDVEALAKSDGIVIADAPPDTLSMVALLVRAGHDHPAGILLQHGLDRGRRKFSIGHELGHQYLPRHVQRAYPCSELDVGRGPDPESGSFEREANIFAAELLMPRRLFEKDIDKRDASIRTAVDLAGPDFFDVSISAASWRLVELTAEPALLVCAVEGKVSWSIRSSTWAHGFARRDTKLDARTLAAAAFRGESVDGRCESVDPVGWMNATFVSEQVRLLESVHYAPRMRATLSMLWSPDRDQ